MVVTLLNGLLPFLVSLLVLCVLPYVAYVLLLIWRFGWGVISALVRFCWEDVYRRLFQRDEERSERHRHRHFRRTIREREAKNGGGRGWGFQRKRASGQEDLFLRDVTKGCSETHYMAGHIYGVTHMSELQGHQLCAARREDTLRLLDCVGRKIGGDEEKVLDSPGLAKKVLVLDAAHENCANCDMLRYAREEAPRLCMTARVFGAEVSAA